ncbi:MAG TPA: AraC family transcriptional regulator [Paenibacillus sp.]|jgi:AraC family transcriptional regulator
MNNINLVSRSIDYIENHLEQELSLKGIAQAMFYSEYHFHRIFQHFTGETVSNYVRKRRLSNAAELLAYTDRKVLDIAMECGFGSHETFTRAFRKMYGMLPSDCRKRGIPPFIVPRAAPLLMSDESITLNWSDYRMQHRIETLPAMRIIGFSLTTTTDNGQNHKEIPEFWQKYMHEQWRDLVPGKKRPEVELGVCTPVDEDGSFRYIIGFEVDNETAVPEGMAEFLIPEATYAIFTTPPADNERFSLAIQETWGVIFRDWIPSSGYEQACSPDFEWYDERCWGDTDIVMDIYIPVQPTSY